MIKFSHKGNFDKTERFLKNPSKWNMLPILQKYGQDGVNALRANTPIDSSETANAWTYEIATTSGKSSISWHNSKMAGNTPLVILLQYGHGTRNGGFVQGRDIVNPAIQPILDKIAEDAWKEVTKI